MAITKTKFINYIRCPRYAALDEIKQNELEADVSLDMYKKEEQAKVLSELYGIMVDENGESLIDGKDIQLETLMPYYNQIEELAIRQVKKQLGGNPIPNINEPNQESFDFNKDGVKYLCYVDIYNENKNGFDIIEVKGTTSKKFLELGPTIQKEKQSIFTKNDKGIYCLKEEENVNIEEEMPMAKYYEYKKKLSDKYHDCGRYVYDLLVQRMIIEGYLKENNQKDKIDKVKYYLAVLNSNYVFGGNYNEKLEPVYEPDEDGNEIILFFDLTKLTKELMDNIELDRERVHEYLIKMDISKCDLGIHCEHKKNTKCAFLDICFYNIVPKHNSVLNYVDNHLGFKDQDGNKYTNFELINMGKVNMIDIDDNLLTRKNNQIQKEVLIKGVPHLNKQKIKDSLVELKYPLYHLDFETFPCPLPRYKGEKCYTQSVFQFSLHIEMDDGVCDKENDHYEFLAKNHDDSREEIVKRLCEYIDINKGTIIAYNHQFEKGRLSELAEIFPQYKKELLKMRDMSYDLLYIIKNNAGLYKELGYSEEEIKEFNYYHSDLNGSFSIKKVLPIFAPELNYNNLDVTNGTDALVTYATFPKLSQEEITIKHKALLEYCKQDTWAMVIILKNIKKLIK